MLTVQYAKDPVWNDVTEDEIFLIVKFVEFNDEVPFTATTFDPMPYGVDLYNRAVAGEFGPIAPYVPPKVDELNQPQTQGAQTL
jgi:hypothetical protein